MTRWKRLALILIGVFGLLTPLSASVSHPPVCLVLLSGTSLGDWRNASSSPTLQRLLAEGSVAVMNVRTARSSTEDEGPSAISAAVSVTAGARCTGSSETTSLVPAMGQSPFDGTMRDILLRRTGIRAPTDSLVDITWPKLIFDNNNLGYKAEPGNLVSVLRSHGITTYASGGTRARPDAFVAAIGDGYVERGNGVLPESSLSIVDLGSNLKNIDAPLTRIVDEIDAAHGTLIVASLYTNSADYEAGRRLTPVLFYGAGWPSGVLYSPSTHTAGLVILSDIAPSIAGCFGVSQSGFMYGRALLSVGHSTPGLMEWHQEGSPEGVAAGIEAVANAQRAAMRMLPATAVVLGVLLALLTFVGLRWKTARKLWLCIPMLMLLLILSPNIDSLPLSGSLSCMLIVFTGIYFGMQGTLFALCAASTLLILTSFVHGSWLMHHSLIGYSVIEGARYYGIGNEAMGILFGSSLVAAFLLCRRYEERANLPIIVFFAVTIALLGLPSAGAKVGGVLVGVGTYGVFWLRLTGRRIRFQEGITLGLLTIAVLGAILVVDMHGGKAHASHLAQLWGSTDNEGDLVDAMLRKGKVEIRLLYHSCWTVALVGGLAAVVVMRKRTEDRASQAFQSASVAAIVLTLLLNDAGVVACSLMLPYLAAGGALLLDEGAPAVRNRDAAPSPQSSPT